MSSKRLRVKHLALHQGNRNVRTLNRRCCNGTADSCLAVAVMCGFPQKEMELADSDLITGKVMTGDTVVVNKAVAEGAAPSPGCAITDPSLPLDPCL